MKAIVGGLEFDSDFDSANLADVEVDEECDNGDKCKAFVARTLRDCEGTASETNNRTWFYFAVLRAKAGQKLTMTIRNMNRQSKLFSQGHEPSVRIQQGNATPGKWHRGCCDVDHDFDEDDEEFTLTFSYVFGPKTVETTATYFAFCIPFGYDELQRKLELCDRLFLNADRDNRSVRDVNVGEGEAAELSGSDGQSSEQPFPQIYYHRELVVRTLDRLRVDLITVSDFSGISDELEPRLDGLFPDVNTQRARKFPTKKVVFLSARVHPGETPASHVFNGFFDFVLRSNDERAVGLRQLYVFKFIPMLNPDGVKRGHYRADSRGLNLNRFYDKPSLQHHPSIYAARQVLLHHNQAGNLSFYIDLHAHVQKRGCFVYGNALELARQIDNVAYARLVAMNTAHFDFKGSCFSEGNMFAKDKRDNGLSKEGSGRVGMFLATNLTHCYTVECNYNTGKQVNLLPPCSGDGGRGEPAPMLSQPPPYTQEIYEDVGCGFALALLDIVERNPWSRLPNSEFVNLSGLKKHVAECIRSSRMKQGKPPSQMPRRVAVALRQQQAIQNLSKNGTHTDTIRDREKSKMSRVQQRPQSVDRQKASGGSESAIPSSRKHKGTINRASGIKARLGSECSNSRTLIRHPPPRSLKKTVTTRIAPSMTATAADARQHHQQQVNRFPPKRVTLAMNTSSIGAVVFQQCAPLEGHLRAKHSLTRKLTSTAVKHFDFDCGTTISKIPRPASGSKTPRRIREYAPTVGMRKGAIPVSGGL